MGLPDIGIRTHVRTGDTSQVERNLIRRQPPHIVITTPESLYVLLGSESGRTMLSTVRTVIVDEIHALVGNKRGAHLALSLERLQSLANQPVQRVGLSATQKPIETVAKFLIGARRKLKDCVIVDSGHVRERDLQIVVPPVPLEVVMSNEAWQTVDYLILLQNSYGGADSVKYEIKQVAASPESVQLTRGLKEFVVPAGTASTVTTVPPGPRYKPGETFKDCEDCPEMAALPAGSFFMGSTSLEQGHQTSEGPRHRVTISRTFAIGVKEVTFDEYDACVRDHGCITVSDRGWGRGRRPVLNLKLVDVKNYIAWLSETTGQHYFIPSEAEWEYAARAGTETPWNTGDTLITEDANFFNQFQKTVPVGSYAPNGFGLYDMHGNVLEWVQDCMDVGYVGVPNDGSAALGPPCNTRVARGGTYATDHAKTRSATRYSVNESTRYSDTGIRLARSLPQ